MKMPSVLQDQNGDQTSNGFRFHWPSLRESLETTTQDAVSTTLDTITTTLDTITTTVDDGNKNSLVWSSNGTVILSDDNLASAEGVQVNLLTTTVPEVVTKVSKSIIETTKDMLENNEEENQVQGLDWSFYFFIGVLIGILIPLIIMGIMKLIRLKKKRGNQSGIYEVNQLKETSTTSDDSIAKDKPKV